MRGAAVRWRPWQHQTVRSGSGFGANSWLVEEMYEQFVHDPNSVSESWQEFFADYQSQTPRVAAAAAASTQVREIADGARAPSDLRSPRPATQSAADAGARAPHRSPPSPAAPAPTPVERTRQADPWRRRGDRGQHGAQPRRCRRPRASATCRPSCSRSTARSSTASASAPARPRSASPTSSGTPSCAPSPTRCPAMKNTFLEGADGKPRLVVNDHVNMGLAVDVSEGRRQPHARRARRPRRRHARLRRVPRRVRGDHPQGQEQQAGRRGLPGRQRLASPTRARSAPSSRCRA